MKRTPVAVTACATLALLTSVVGQNFEFMPHVGGQINGRLDLTTSLFHRFEVANGVNYGMTVGYLLGWRALRSRVFAESKQGRYASLTVWRFINHKTLHYDQNQYLGNFLFHFTPREDKLRPFLMAEVGAAALDPNVQGVSGTTRFVYALGRGRRNTMSVITSVFEVRLNGPRSISRLRIPDIGVILSGAAAG